MLDKHLFNMLFNAENPVQEVLGRFAYSYPCILLLCRLQYCLINNM